MGSDHTLSRLPAAITLKTSAARPRLAVSRLQACDTAGRRAALPPKAFTLIELILVMAILTIAVSITAPALANFFRGRTLDSEARRLLALTRQAQSRAVSEGVPVELWVDSKQSKVGMDSEPSYETTDPKGIELTLDSDMQLDTGNDPEMRQPNSNNMRSPMGSRNPGVANQVLSHHPDLPRIRFMPDGSIAETSPQKLTLTGRDGFSISLKQARSGLNYELVRGN